jgi:hypothetical protein
VFRWIEALVEKLYVSVGAGHLASHSRVAMVRCCLRQSGSFGLEPGSAKHGSSLRGGLLVGFDLEWMPPSALGCAGVDGPGLSFLPVPVPGEVFDGLVDVVDDGVDVGGVSGSAHGDVSEFSPAAIREKMGRIEGCPLASMNGGGVSEGEFVGADLIGPTAWVRPSSVRTVRLPASRSTPTTWPR